MQISHTRKIEQELGVASTLKADDFIPQYIGGIAKFLRDNQSTMGEQWVKETAEKLYNFQGKNKEGDSLGSSTILLAAISHFCPEIPLITGQQLFDLYKQAGNKNPFGDVYIDFGVQVNGKPSRNPAQAKALLESYKANGIDSKKIVVPNFAQVSLLADKEAGLVLKLKEGVKQSDLALASDYPFEGRVGENGLFRAYLYGYGGWCACIDYLADSGDGGRVVRYDDEGVVPKKKEVEYDLITRLQKEFAKKY